MEHDKKKLPVIKFGQENAPVLLDLQNSNEASLFASVHSEAFKKIKEYIQNIEERNVISEQNIGNPLYRNENYNNIFAFCGERGSGKTSCMQTVAYNINFRLKDKYKFNILDVIDPSFFDSTHNILELVISQLFKEFTKKLGQYAYHCNNQEWIQNKKRVLIKQFQIVKENITNLEAKCDPDETIESLAKLSASMDLGKSIFDLVDKYLEFCDNSGFLVIQIDDIDLNTEHAYKMIEQIRKYLIQSNIIILMAIKLEQLEDVVKLDYQTKFEKLSNAKNMSGSIIDYAKKYISKFIPETKRIYIPTIHQLIDIEVDIKVDGFEQYKTLKEYHDGAIERIYCSKNLSRIFLPDNLREFLSICNSIAEHRVYTPIQRVKFLTHINNEFTEFDKYIDVLINSSYLNINERIIIILYNAYRSMNKTINLMMDDIDIQADVTLPFDQFYKNVKLTRTQSGDMKSGGSSRISLSDVLNAFNNCESKARKGNDNYTLFVELCKALYDIHFRKMFIGEKRSILKIKGLNYIFHDLDSLINGTIINIPLKVSFKEDLINQYFHNEKIEDADLGKLIEKLDDKEHLFLLSILKYFRRSFRLIGYLNKPFNPFYLWKNWILETIESTNKPAALQYDKTIAHLPLNLSIFELCSINSKMDDLLFLGGVSDIKELNQVIDIALKEIQKTNSINDNKEFGLLLEAYDYIVNTNPDSPIVDILSKITDFNG